MFVATGYQSFGLKCLRLTYSFVRSTAPTMQTWDEKTSQSKYRYLLWGMYTVSHCLLAARKTHLKNNINLENQLDSILNTRFVWAGFGQSMVICSISVKLLRGDATDSITLCLLRFETKSRQSRDSTLKRFTLPRFYSSLFIFLYDSHCSHVLRDSLMSVCVL